LSDLSNTIDTDGVSGDYASMDAAIAGEAQDLTDGGGDTWTGICAATTGTSDSTAIEVTGWTTAVANWMKFEAGSGEEAVKTGIDTNIYRTETSLIDVLEDYVYFEKLQFVASSSFIMLRVNSVSASNAIYIDSCYFEGSGGAGNEQGLGSVDDDANIFVTNTVMFDIRQRCVYLTNGTASIYNCSFRGDNFRAGIDASVGTTITVKNTAVFNTTDDFSLSGTSTVDYCASDDGDGTNAQTPSGADWDNEYNDPSNGDFTAITGGNIESNGVGPSIDANVPTTDIDGTSRSGATCDIGADEIAGGVIYDMSGTGEIAFEGAADLTALNNMVATGEIAFEGAADLTALKNMIATGEIAFEGAAAILAIISMSATGEIAIEGTADLRGPIGLSATGEMGISGDAFLNSLKAMAANGEIAFEGSGDLTFVGVDEFNNVTFFTVTKKTDILSEVEKHGDILNIVTREGA
jgi:hypothetical protein